MHGGVGGGVTDGHDDARYWVGFSQAKFIGPTRIARLRERFGDLATAWGAPVHQLRAVLDERALDGVLKARRDLDLEREMERYDRLGVGVLTLAHEAYPRLLREIPAPPPVLYVKGRLFDGDHRAVGIVGTRRFTPYGREVAATLAGDLAAGGVTVVSGLARGIDGVAHQAALQAGGRTVAVLGCGPDVVYPPEHRALADRIAEHGALVSEYPPGRQPDAQNFPARNRIISGLSLGVVVIEAPERSGALITADFAADQGRDVFVVPGSVLAAASAGTNRLLRDGARPVRSAADVLEDLGLDAEPDAAPIQQALPLGDAERRLLAVLTREPQHIDEVAALADLPIAEASALLTMLELHGAVRNAGALHYARR
jgi:DNA processing protein